MDCRPAAVAADYTDVSEQEIESIGFHDLHFPIIAVTPELDGSFTHIGERSVNYARLE